MISIHKFKTKYVHEIDLLDLDLLICHIIKKGREFIFTHPEYKLTLLQTKKIISLVNRRLKNEPLAYILGEKEFYGLSFKVNRYTLIPRPETELMVEMALEDMQTNERMGKKTTVVDIGTGSGNIIISLAHKIKQKKNKKFFAIDISEDALRIAKQNARLNKVDKNIKFLHGNLLEPLIQNLKLEIRNSKLIILANLPYLSKKIYETCADNVKNHEPKTALYSPREGLAHYDKLLGQILELKYNYTVLCPETKPLGIICFMEISPEQKKLLLPLARKYFPKAKIGFEKDLAQKWRICKIKI